MTCGALRLLFDYYREKPRKPCLARLPRFFSKMAEICATPTKPLRRRAFRLDGLITPTLKAAGSNPVGRTILTKRLMRLAKSQAHQPFPGFFGPGFFLSNHRCKSLFQSVCPDSNRAFSLFGQMHSASALFEQSFSRLAAVFFSKKLTKTWASFCWL